MYGVAHDYHYPENDKQKNHLQCNAQGIKGRYIIRQYGEQKWWAIQLFGAVGCIAGEGKDAEEAFEIAERKLNESTGSKKH